MAVTEVDLDIAPEVQPVRLGVWGTRLRTCGGVPARFDSRRCSFVLRRTALQKCRPHRLCGHLAMTERFSPNTVRTCRK